MFLARGLGCVLSWQPSPIVHELFSLAFQVAYPLSGYGNAAFGLELDSIASVVIGGTLLTGGVGSVLGTLIGVLILGLIQTFISFQGTLNTYWTKIFIGMMLFAFILLQKAFVAGAGRAKK
jgi:simple sugar transport system permease protein